MLLTKWFENGLLGQVSAFNIIRHEPGWNQWWKLPCVAKFLSWKKKTVLQNALRKTFFDHDWAATSNKVFWHEFSIAKCSAFRVIWQCRLGWNQSSQMLLNALFNERLGWIVHYSTWNRQKSVMISWKIALPGHPFKIRQTRWTCTKFVFSSFHFLYKQTGPTVACTSTLNQSGLDTASAILATWKMN